VAHASRGPGVPFPPPFVFVAGFLLGWWLNTRLEFTIDGRGAGVVQSAAGLASLAAGLGLMCWGIVTFIMARTAVIPTRPARALVVRGPYRFTRNPMYLGMTFAYVGLSALLNQAWPLLMLPLVLLTLQMAVIGREERHLRAAFGPQYDDYCRRVRRWV
jgi:protein-S-isoprenylcysteine O-methyltransferase Ste14